MQFVRGPAKAEILESWFWFWGYLRHMQPETVAERCETANPAVSRPAVGFAVQKWWRGPPVSEILLGCRAGHGRSRARSWVRAGGGALRGGEGRQGQGWSARSISWVSEANQLRKTSVKDCQSLSI